MKTIGKSEKASQEMECSVCYSSTAKCQLVCGHQFCHGCVKEWYQKCEDCPTCPMCRGNLYFRGMRKHVEKWDKEAEEAHRAHVWEECVETVLDYGDEDDLFVMEERFNILKDTVWLDTDIILDEAIVLSKDSEPPEYWETKSWDTLLFVSKHGFRRSYDSARRNWLLV